MEHDLNISVNKMSEIKITQPLTDKGSGENNARDTEGPTPEQQERYNRLVLEAKKEVQDGHVQAALRLNQKALKIFHSDKLAKKISKMEAYLKTLGDESSEEEENGMVHVGDGFYLYKDLHASLYNHQQAGVLWLWSLFRKKKGGILGDDMGLGKTIQVIGFLSGMFDMGKIQSVLIVLPVALIVNWENEFEKWAPGLKVTAYHGSSKKEKERALARVQRRGGICLTTYGLVVTSWEQLGQKDGREFTWDYMILDEGHKIKNPTKTSKGVHAIPAKNRIILTGTPVQNNLRELWALFDFVHQGSLLGTARTFKMEYDNPITRAREKDATAGEKKLGMEMSESLKRIISPYFLRRTKGEVQDKEDKENRDPGAGEKQSKHAKMPTMSRKNDLIVWTFLTDTQLKIYQDFLSLDSVKELLMTSKSPLVALTVLKKICDHPRLLSTRACAQLGIDGDEGVNEDMLETEEGNLAAATRIQHIEDRVLVGESGKLIFLVSLVDQLKREGHRCLVFSQSRKMLDIMQKVITNRGHKVMRLDGTIGQVYEREQRINKFKSDQSYSVFLLTTQVGGVGLTLTAADRVVIFDPSWNPATDAQAVDRAFRIGQDKNVVIYRLITCGTVEEKIYRRQIFKDSITRQTTGNAKNPHRYFSKYELKELFTMDDPHSSTTQQQLEQMHGGQRLTDPSLDQHIAFLYSLNMFGLSDHDLMFTQGASAGDDQDEDGYHDAPQNDYIQERVRKARELIQMESSQTTTYQERNGQFSRNTDTATQRMPANSWDFPRQEFKREEAGVPMPIKAEMDTSIKSEVSEDHIDLTSPESSPAKVAVVTGKAIDLTEADTSINEPSTTDRDSKIHVKEEAEPEDLESSFVTMTIDDGQTLGTGAIKQEPSSPARLPLRVQQDPAKNSPILVGSVGDTPGNCRQHSNRSHLSTPRTPHQRTPKTPHTPKTPRDAGHIIEEEIFISPDASRPVVKTEPRHKSPYLAIRHLSGSPAGLGKKTSRLNSTLFSAFSESPADTGRSRTSLSSTSSAGSNQPFVEDSPAGQDKQVQKRMNTTVVVDSPVGSYHSNLDGGRGSSSVDESLDEVLEETADESCIQDSGDEDPRSPIHDAGRAGMLSPGGGFCNPCSPGAEDSPIQSRCLNRSVSARRRVIESSDDDSDSYEQASDNENNSNDEVDDIGYQGDDPDDEEVSHHDDNNNDYSMVNDDAEEEAAAEGLNETDHNVSMAECKDTGVGEEIQESIHDETGEATDEDIETGEATHEDIDTGEATHEDMGVDQGEEDEEEMEEREDEDGMIGFDMLSEEEQEEYNRLVELGRELCGQRQYEEAQTHVLQALEIYQDPELQATAIKLQQKILKHRGRQH